VLRRELRSYRPCSLRRLRARVRHRRDLCREHVLRGLERVRRALRRPDERLDELRTVRQRLHCTGDLPRGLLLCRNHLRLRSDAMKCDDRSRESGVPTASLLARPTNDGEIDHRGVDLDLDAMNEAEDGRFALLGTVLAGRYEIDEVIGSGGVGVVYGGKHRELGRPVAVKVLAPLWASHGDAITRFEREARWVSTLGHPNIVDVHDFGRLEDGRPYLVMERLDGESLGKRLRRVKRLAPAQAATILAQIASALDLVHEHGIVHRDIKPDNVFMTTDFSGKEKVKLLDFGLATAPSDRRLTQQGCVCGTPDYLAPEVANRAELDRSSDIYALGVTLFEMLTGRVPFEGPSPWSILARKYAEPAPTLAHAARIPFSEAVELVVAKALEREPGKRHRSAGELEAEFRRAVEGSEQPWVQPDEPELAATSGDHVAAEIGAESEEPPIDRALDGTADAASVAIEDEPGGSSAGLSAERTSGEPESLEAESRDAAREADVEAPPLSEAQREIESAIESAIDAEPSGEPSSALAAWTGERNAPLVSLDTGFGRRQRSAAFGPERRKKHGRPAAQADYYPFASPVPAPAAATRALGWPVPIESPIPMASPVPTSPAVSPIPRARESLSEDIELPLRNRTRPWIVGAVAALVVSACAAWAFIENRRVEAAPVTARAERSDSESPTPETSIAPELVPIPPGREPPAEPFVSTIRVGARHPSTIAPPPEALPITPPISSAPASVEVLPIEEANEEPAPAAASEPTQLEPPPDPPVSRAREIVPESDASVSSTSGTYAALTREGYRRLARGELAMAVERFEAASARNSAALRGLGLAYERLGRRADAARAYRRYLSALPNAPDRNEVEARLDALR
jgi:serine/threonine protein kinase